ncbi:DUF3810 domain-containing protein [Dokdonia sp. Hel_I_53]|uniref:DUF3810 domain-containing protein n=1 Tax=Dokdonia sp. Hel_I_53 TaxID=1566287 RepID=UPI0011998739|nr:DUF3810 domain-containing protein [Dokdonia sp. Hel_I_53]TVZ51045.1 uncharacterized protein DUF3810 [Dokdonia sp. Hel_I_53]
MKKNRTYIIIALALPLQMLLVRLLAKYPTLIEEWYSNGLYPILSKGFRYALGWLPFSFGDLLYFAVILFALSEIIKLVTHRFKTYKSFLIKGCAVLSVIYFAFHLLWGMNYYRQPLHKAIGVENEYTTEELVAVTVKLIERSNILHRKLSVSDSLKVSFGKGDLEAYRREVFKQTLYGYKSLQEKFPKLNYPPPSIKNSLWRYPLSIMGYSGYLNPITNEAQINGMIPPHRWPVVSCHEQAHQLGFAKENEANFIAVMATLHNEDLYFQYSGSIFALRYCINDVYSRDAELGEELKSCMNLGILANYQDSRAFWDEMDNPLEPIFDLLYGNYLKANNQPAGLLSYSYMVALLVNYDKQFPNTF